MPSQSPQWVPLWWRSWIPIFHHWSWWSGPFQSSVRSQCNLLPCRDCARNGLPVEWNPHPHRALASRFDPTNPTHRAYYHNIPPRHAQGWSLWWSSLDHPIQMRPWHCGVVDTRNRIQSVSWSPGLPIVAWSQMSWDQRTRSLLLRAWSHPSQCRCPWKTWWSHLAHNVLCAEVPHPLCPRDPSLQWSCGERAPRWRNLRNRPTRFTMICQ